MSIKTGFLIAFIFSFLSLFAKDLTRQEYIDKYAALAIREMQNYGIPASITMAQGILESNNGNSYLAKEANNHFGIKCHDWVGPSVNKDDDKRNECFRKYDHALASFEDHSSFLADRDRYAFLFDYDVDDYRSWAKGLKKAGYATNPKYPQLLIRIIEENNLDRLDQQVLSAGDDLNPVVNADTSESDVLQNKEKTDHHYKQLDDEVYETENGVRYIVINKPFTLNQIAERFDLHVWELYRYNDVPKETEFNLAMGQRVFVQAKRRRAAKGTAPHRVQTGEQMIDIAQLYGIRLKALYRLNRMSVGTQPVSGVAIELVSRKP